MPHIYQLNPVLIMDCHGVNFIDTANIYEGYARVMGSAGGVAACGEPAAAEFVQT